jgi:SAM-dependent methyltransferase
MDQPADLDKLVTELEAAVEARRRAGEYPEGLGEQLDSEFARDRHFEPFDYAPLERALAALDAAARFGADRIELDSERVGGAIVHRATAAAVRRSVEGVLAQTQAFADQVREVLRHVLDAIDEPRPHEHGDLRGDIDLTLQRLTDVESQVRRLERAAGAFTAVANPLPLDRAALERRLRERSRGGQHQHLLDRIGDNAPVLDLGCGTGDLLVALGERGVDARGVDVDRDLVRYARSRGVEVTEQSAISALVSTPKQTLGAVVLAHLTEQLAPAELVETLHAAHQALRDGGVVILEALDPEAMRAHTHGAWLDPTHQRFTSTAYLEALLLQVGFKDIEVVGIGEEGLEQLTEVPADTPGAEVLNANVRRLNGILFAPRIAMVAGVA